MSREEFLNKLKESLSMSLEKVEINEQLDYYDKYISDEIKKGKSEKEVLDELGDPRLIAKTIKTVNGTENITTNNDDSYNYDNKNNYGSYGSYDNYGRNEDRSKYSGSNQKNYKSYGNYVNNNGTIGCFIAGLIMFIIVYGILSFVGNIAYGVGELAFNGPIGFLLVLGLFYLLFGRKK